MGNYKFDITERCLFVPLTEELASLPFCCGEKEGDKDLEDFFHHSAMLYARERLGKTYNKVQRTLPGQKHLRTYPAVLLGRLGVNKKYQGSEYFVGQQVINFIKSWFVEEDNKTGCRFLVVDAYNQERVLRFYERNKFKYLYATEEQEREEQHFPNDADSIYTRLMFLDLMHTQILDYPFCNTKE